MALFASGDLSFMPRLTPLAGLMAGLAPATLITAASLLGSTAMAATISAPSGSAMSRSILMPPRSAG